MAWVRSEGFRSFVVSSTDGIIGTAGVLLGFAGAGASSGTLLIASISALVAGSVAGFCSKYAELAAERDAERAVIADEIEDLRDPADDLAALAARFEARGVQPTVAREVAEQLFAHDALDAELEFTHGIDEPTRAVEPLLGAAAGAAAIALGSALPLAILVVYPAAWEEWAVALAVILSLTVAGVLTSVTARTSVWRGLARTVGVGVLTMLATYLAGVLIF
ncbi:VIT1/CCC1 transporter family protein [Agromyces agglutinans]|uniref:VIT1/CCC1 transporter family protein n=1 Tax=Agromyces agglutinans TaxID=2662258 RepID=UPI00129A0A70|nr:VIT1/CCC1 transporter family protein [Agromyces agglutinans]